MLLNRDRARKVTSCCVCVHFKLDEDVVRTKISVYLAISVHHTHGLVEQIEPRRSILQLQEGSQHMELRRHPQDNYLCL